ncbi:hypothetical protein [Mucilaginibacter ginsenosidivorans]|uniref:Uncharacterized protein n=1 Tax=Mucilaginibacter ginsenosidivorans TaxID=398053 RepID=A0A5B8UXG9_9SPHI|nr:hypothetical protein [Mucilaginibacter ginsenosidivorans]QEC63365.1 hypothetical protein FRZ54_12530 [Mucilaginibacter ginsenosidivorans]
MKTNYRNSLWLTGMLLAAFSASAQTSVSDKKADNEGIRHNYDIVHNENGNRTERIQTELNNRIYKIEFVNEKMTSLFVDGEKIAPADWHNYNEAIATIRREMKEQARRNAEQAKRNAEQAVRNQQQAKLNAEQEVRNQEQVKRNAEQARLNASQNAVNAEQAVRNQAQALANEDQAKRNEEQVARNKEQAKRNAEQAQQNELQAKKNAEQARANEQMMKDITEDLVTDKIIPDSSGLREMKLNKFGMSVNGVKQPEAIFRKYKEKYSKFFDGNFSYSRDGVIRGSGD